MNPLRISYRKTRFACLAPILPEQDEILSSNRSEIRKNFSFPDSFEENNTSVSQPNLNEDKFNENEFNDQTEAFDIENNAAEMNEPYLNENEFNEYEFNYPTESHLNKDNSNNAMDSAYQFDTNCEFPHGMDLNDTEVIYPDSHVTVKNSSFFLLAFMERFNLSEVCREELLSLVQYHLPLGNKVAKSINKLNSTIDLNKSTVFKRLFCQTCGLEVILGPINANQAPSFCNCVIRTGDYDSFLYMDVFDQLSFLVKKYHDNMEAQLKNSREFLDLTDGDYYSSIKRLNKRHVVIYADGTPVRKTTRKRQFWPVMIGLAELPLSLRESIKNKIICGKKK